jgi:hypothetical protein
LRTPAEIRNFQDALVGDQQVVRLDISMHDTQLVQKTEALKQLVSPIDCRRLRETPTRLLVQLTQKISSTTQLHS